MRCGCRTVPLPVLLSSPPILPLLLPRILLLLPPRRPLLDPPPHKPCVALLEAVQLRRPKRRPRLRRRRKPAIHRQRKLRREDLVPPAVRDIESIRSADESKHAAGFGGQGAACLSSVRLATSEDGAELRPARRRSGLHTQEGRKQGEAGG